MNPERPCSAEQTSEGDSCKQVAPGQSARLDRQAERPLQPEALKNPWSPRPHPGEYFNRGAAADDRARYRRFELVGEDLLLGRADADQRQIRGHRGQTLSQPGARLLLIPAGAQLVHQHDLVPPARTLRKSQSGIGWPTEYRNSELVIAVDEALN
ncbi:MAG TPA: hypothetical protein VME22_13340 [Solirubrobacteraceae bacterium]|nr:hypothetical protein [Solirubrobacteraceae bacterium]